MGQKVRTLIVATSRKTQGGITTVLNEHESSAYWAKYECVWIETHINKQFIHKLWYVTKALLKYLFIVYKYKIVHIHTSEPPSALRKLPFTFIAKLFNKKVIIHLHSFSPDTTVNSKWGFLYRIHSACADKVILLSQQAQKEFCGTNIPLEKSAIIYNPCSAKPLNRGISQEKIILYAGALNSRKGYKDLIEAFATIATRHPEWRVVLAGSGEMEQAQEIARNCGIASQIELPGWITGEEKDALFSKASIFCLPSYAEGFPMAVLDAWGYSLPVITTPVGGLPDVLVDGENALVFTPGDTERLAAHIDLLITNEELRRRIADNSHTLATTKFSMSAISNDIEHLYQNLLNQ